jgi:conjugative transposon TraN protein
MRKCVVMIVCVILLFTGYRAGAQDLVTEVKGNVIPTCLEITNKKTTNLIFPYAVKSVDRGSVEVLVQKAKGVENILQVKAASDTMKETNLTVVCSDGTLYSFIIYYQASPDKLNFSLGRVTAQTPWALFSAGDNNEAKINDLATQLTHKKRLIPHLMTAGNDILLGLGGVYIKDDILYLQIDLENRSAINYTVDQLRFYTKDLKKAKRTAAQQVQFQPLQVSGNATVIGSKSAQTVVVALPKFTIPDQKIFVIEMMEKDGGRNLSIRIKNKFLIRATSI